MLQIYAIPVSLYCAKLRVLLRQKGLEWQELPPPGGYGSDEYKTHVPSGNLPALRDGELLIADSEAIGEYLNEVHAEPAMLPPDPAGRARTRALSRFHDTRLEPAVRALFAHLPGRTTPPDGFISSQSGVISQRLGQLGRTLEDRPDSPLPLMCDCGFPITFAWLDALTPRMGLDLEWPGEVASYRARLGRMPAIAAELADYTPKLNAFLDG